MTSSHNLEAAMFPSGKGAIRVIIAARAKAVHAGDVGALVADLADDVSNYDVVNLLSRDIKAASRERADHRRRRRRFRPRGEPCDRQTEVRQ
jgi:hypothetical protein